VPVSTVGYSGILLFGTLEEKVVCLRTFFHLYEEGYSLQKSRFLCIVLKAQVQSLFGLLIHWHNQPIKGDLMLLKTTFNLQVALLTLKMYLIFGDVLRICALTYDAILNGQCSAKRNSHYCIKVPLS
jgi:hypothetical protein